MNRNQAKELFPIIKAFAEGRTIQYRIMVMNLQFGMMLIKNIMTSSHIHFSIASSQSQSIAHSRTQKSAGLKWRNISRLGGLN